MSLQFSLSDFDDYQYKEADFEAPAIQNLINQNNFDNNEDAFALIGCGGTISSAYAPSYENIQATHYSPTKDILNDLYESFGIAEKNVSFISLINKDSRDIAVNDMIFILNFLNGIQNKRIVLTCGTYGLPLFTQIIGKHVKSSNKIIGLTGSILISAMREHDIDFNGGGAISAVNALSKLGLQDTSHAAVFCNFHGKIYTADECLDLDLHPEEHKNVEFYRGQRLVRKSEA